MSYSVQMKYLGAKPKSEKWFTLNPALPRCRWNAKNSMNNSDIDLIVQQPANIISDISVISVHMTVSIWVRNDVNISIAAG